MSLLTFNLRSLSLGELRRYCDARCVCVRQAANARRISLGREGIALYPVLSSFWFVSYFFELRFILIRFPFFTIVKIYTAWGETVISIQYPVSLVILLEILLLT